MKVNHNNNTRLFFQLLAHPLVQKDQRLQEVEDACADLLRREAVEQQLQGLHVLRYQMNGARLHGAGQEAQQTRMPQRLQVLQEMKTVVSLNWNELQSLLV